jgi:hypothetical protein
MQLPLDNLEAAFSRFMSFHKICVKLLDPLGRLIRVYFFLAMFMYDYVSYGSYNPEVLS